MTNLPFILLGVQAFCIGVQAHFLFKKDYTMSFLWGALSLLVAAVNYWELY